MYVVHLLLVYWWGRSVEYFLKTAPAVLIVKVTLTQQWLNDRLYGCVWNAVSFCEWWSVWRIKEMTLPHLLSSLCAVCICWNSVFLEKLLKPLTRIQNKSFLFCDKNTHTQDKGTSFKGDKGSWKNPWWPNIYTLFHTSSKYTPKHPYSHIRQKNRKICHQQRSNACAAFVQNWGRIVTSFSNSPVTLKMGHGQWTHYH